MTGKTTRLNQGDVPAPDKGGKPDYTTQPLKLPSPQPVAEGTRPLGAPPYSPPATPTGELPRGDETARLDTSEVAGIVEQASQGEASSGESPPKLTTGEIAGLMENLDNLAKQRSAVDTVCDILVKEFPHLRAEVEVSEVEIVRFPKDDTGKHIQESVREKFNVTPLESIRKFVAIAAGDSRLNVLATRSPDHSPEQMATGLADQILETIAGMKIVYPKLKDADRAELPFFTQEQKQLLFLDLVRGNIIETLSNHITTARASANNIAR